MEQQVMLREKRSGTIVKFFLDREGRLEVETVLLALGARLVKLDDGDGCFSVLEQNPYGKSLNVFKPGQIVDVVITSQQQVQANAESNITNILIRHISLKRPAIARLGPNDSVYMAKFPSARAPLCSFNGKPCMLWEGVASGFVELDKRLAGRCSGQQVTVLLAPSGSGKTRMLIELASTRFSLFFTGDRPMVGFGGGSKDVRLVANWVANRFPGGERNIDPEHPVVQFGVGALILARLTYFKLLKECKPGLVPRDWAFFQLEYPAVDDCFRDLVQNLLDLVEDGNLDHFMVAKFRTIIGELVKEVGWGDGVVVLDEAQSLLQCMNGHFKSTRTPVEGQSLLNPVVLALKTFGSLNSGVFVSGTGKSMLTVRENLLSGTMKPFDVGEIYNLPGFDSTNIQSFLERFIDCSQLDMEAIISTYTGRRRLLSFAIETYILEIQQPEADWLMRFSRRMINETGQQLGVIRSLRDEAVLVWKDPKTASFIEDLVFTYYLSGAGYLILPADKSALTLLDCGFATLLESGDGFEPFSPILPHIRGVSEVQAPFRYIILHEPLVLDALWQHMPTGTILKRFVNSSRDPSIRGINFERVACTTLGEAFHEKIPADVLGITATHIMYKDTYELLTARGLSKVLVQEINTPGQLNEWVEAVETGVSFATYGWTGPLQGGGPDAVFFLWNANTNKRMPVFVQFKTGDELLTTQAFGSLDTTKLDKTVKKLREWCSTGYIRLVVTTNPHARVGHLAFEEVRRSERLKGNTSASVPPLSAVWVGDRLVGIVNAELLEAVEELKKNLHKRKRATLN